MPLRSRAMVPSTASQVIIRVESYSADRMAGLFYNPYLDKIESFNDVIDLTNKLDGMFDQLSFPQANMSYRSFTVPRKGKKTAAAPLPAPSPARLGGSIQRLDQDVFLVHVQFRQNADWQGTVKWAGSQEEQRFHSILQLIKILDAALLDSHPKPLSE